jgi:hypothetical protein
LDVGGDDGFSSWKFVECAEERMRARFTICDLRFTICHLPFAICHLLLLALFLASQVLAGEIKPLYENNFEKAQVGGVPEEMLVLEGAFAVREEGGNKFLELPGAPLDTYGVLFGPTEVSGRAVQARIYGTSKGRRFPTLAVGLNGVGGYRLQISPGKKALELLKGDNLLASVPFTWESGAWTTLRLQSRKVKEGEIKVEGKAWKQDGAEPKAWAISYTDTAESPAGKASVWASPYAGTPVRFDDLLVTTAGP